jgi:hypothetical protein
MNRVFIWISAVALMIGLVSCGGKRVKQEELTKTIPASAVKITGDCSNFFTVSGDVKVVLTKVDEDRENAWEVRAIIPFSKTSEAMSWSELEALPHIEKYGRMYGFSSCSSETRYLDEYGTELNMDLETIGVEELLKSKEMADNIVTQYLWGFVDQDRYENAKAKFDKVSGIKLVVNEVFDNYLDDEKPSVSGKKSATSSGKDWDAFLDEYESYVDQYIKMYKKMMNGDMSVMAEYADLFEKAEKLSDQIEKSQNEMTSAQMKRYFNITQKMSDALLE